MISKGFFLTHRSIIDHPIVGLTVNLQYYALWSWILSQACWKDSVVWHNGGQYNLSAGELIVKQSELAKIVKFSPKQIRTFIKTLEKNGMIQVQNINRGTLLKLQNYKYFQGFSGDENRGGERAVKGQVKGQDVIQQIQGVSTPKGQRKGDEGVGERAIVYNKQINKETIKEKKYIKKEKSQIKILSEDWRPSGDTERFFYERTGFDKARFEQEVAKFVKYHRDKKTNWKNYDTAFKRTWISNLTKKSGESKTSGSGSIYHGTLKQTLEWGQSGSTHRNG